jgi:hypothetical protein
MITSTMTTENLRQRQPPAYLPIVDTTATPEKPKLSNGPIPHPAGEIKHGPWQQALRMFLFAVYFNGSCLALV